MTGHLRRLRRRCTRGGARRRIITDLILQDLHKDLVLKDLKDGLVLKVLKRPSGPTGT